MLRGKVERVERVERGTVEDQTEMGSVYMYVPVIWCTDSYPKGTRSIPPLTLLCR